MNRELWTYNETGEVDEDSDANDYYFKWLTVKAPEYDSLEELFEKFIGYGKVRIKARDGALFFVRAGDKDDTPNPDA